VIGLLLVACGPSPAPRDASPCPTSFPASCPPTPPSYAHDIAPLIQARCSMCHFPGTTIAPFSLATYSDVGPRAMLVYGQVYTCTMPKAPAPPLTDAERTLFLTWLTCNAPNN
jgi:uncharacterized membrane protein